MANETPRMKITYPSVGEANYFSNYQAGMNDIDAGIFATWSASNTITNGGGTLTWDLVGPDYTLTWTAPIAFQTPAFGTAQSIALGSLIISEGLLAYTDIAFGSTAASTSLVLTAASQAPVDTAALVLAWHNPATNALHFASGLVLALGGTATGIQPQGGGGGSITVTDGTTTVNPTTVIDFTAGAVVTDALGGTAEVLIPLTTQFVVSKDGSTQYSTVQSAIDDARGAVISTGRDQTVFIRSGKYIEDLIFRPKVSLVSYAHPELDNFASRNANGAAPAVAIDGNHLFREVDGAPSASITGIKFSPVNLAQPTIRIGNGSAASPSEGTISFSNCSIDCTSTGSPTTAAIVTAVGNFNEVYVTFDNCTLISNRTTASADFITIQAPGPVPSSSTFTFKDCQLYNAFGPTCLALNCQYQAIKVLNCNLERVNIKTPTNANLTLTNTTIFTGTTDAPLLALGAGNIIRAFNNTLISTNSSFCFHIVSGNTLYDSGNTCTGFTTNIYYDPTARDLTSPVVTAAATRASSWSKVVTCDTPAVTNYQINDFTSVVLVSPLAIGASSTISLPDARACIGSTITIVDNDGGASLYPISIASPYSSYFGAQLVIAENRKAVTLIASAAYDGSGVAGWIVVGDGNTANTTQFVVSLLGDTLYTSIQDAIDAANQAFIATSLDQIVFVRGGTYTENITFRTGVRVVAEGNPNAKQFGNWIGTISRSPAAAVVVQGNHSFAIGPRLRTTIQGITFVTASATLFTLADTGGENNNTIQFFDCLLAGDSMGSGDTLFTVDDASCADLSLHFERCSLFFLPSSSAYDPMLLLGSDGSDQFYTFVDCLFDTKGGTGRVYFGCSSSGGCEARFTRCKLSYVDIANNGSLRSQIGGDLWVTDVTIEQPERYPIAWNNNGTVYASRCNLASNGSYPAITTGSGYVLLDAVTTVPWYFIGEPQPAQGIGVGNYVMPARTIEGTTVRNTIPTTRDLDALFDQGYNITNLSWNTVGAAGLREVQLHNAAKTMGMYFTVWDSGNNANSNNITVTSPASTGGVTGPHTVIAHANGSLTFVATVDAAGDACWRSISYYH